MLNAEYPNQARGLSHPGRKFCQGFAFVVENGLKRMQDATHSSQTTYISGANIATRDL